MVAPRCADERCSKQIGIYETFCSPHRKERDLPVHWKTKEASDKSRAVSKANGKRKAYNDLNNPVTNAARKANGKQKAYNDLNNPKKNAAAALALRVAQELEHNTLAPGESVDDIEREAIVAKILREFLIKRENGEPTSIEVYAVG